MSTILKITTFFVPIFIAFLIHQSQFLLPIVPQIIAATSLIIIFLLIFANRLFLPLVVFILNLIVFSTGGVNSSIFFLIYFLLFSLAFQSRPLTNLIYSLITIVFFSYSLSSVSSLIQLFSLLLITPLTYFISQQKQLQENTEAVLSQDETDFLLWISLRLKTSLREIISFSDNSKINKIAKNLLKDSEKLQKNIDNNSDET
ncbi:MAG: hypothetical protein US68_C0001G0071 [Candidatus Shapirobacteria bacterium GW2011_GWE1_38_10]|uniref:Uncharacterized protein n=1 Tax=Candidatus Shapirobacteria bacterium GW2011_GWE1_38_10 TaxID=1618488 RepID=A0A0G0I8K3_9BACT|nr:MAG: hypothetical protein US46_C0004G0011 [Candidatus Shapirobacteria bacterium GW2011_GWF2_37_20]KKQ50872.1 MAG: hypothetical protein US68_C0001G0071 [Candidatus Shapirobacteria bacterium GW2011_GWE1_38_10]KKQ63640.1 MAG: hypothetical protein US85_C0015G0022 [Candidatus Shapirobacteria bacterium GW2011_GWF1_38_23]HBP51085.1 hypothetical protein [Candidatus Shapirobacteria bacterium]